MKHFLLALQFLTIIPVPGEMATEKRDFSKVLRLFPAVGLVLGILLCAAWFIFNPLPILAKSVLIIILHIVLTGGLHLDGFIDTCDGLYGFHSKDKALRIMRESCIGAMGAVGAICLLLAKFAFITGVPDALIYKVLLGMPVLSRWAMTFACCATDYPRQEGKAKIFIEAAKFKDVFISGLCVFVFYLWLFQLHGVVIFFLTFLCVVLFKRYVKKRIGGMTGDTIGAVNEISEAAMLFFVLLIL